MMSLHEPFLPATAKQQQPSVGVGVVRLLALCQAVLCLACTTLMLLGWRHLCSNPRKLSCREGLAQSVVVTLNAARVCLLLLDVAGFALAVSVLQLYRHAGEPRSCNCTSIPVPCLTQRVCLAQAPQRVPMNGRCRVASATWKRATA